MNDSEFTTLIGEARDWIADAFDQDPLDFSEVHPAYTLFPSQVRRTVTRHYDGGWDAFVADFSVQPGV